MSKYVMAIDQGTTGSTVVIVDEELGVRSKVNQEFAQIYPQPGWVEHDPEAIWSSVGQAVKQALDKAGIDGRDVAAIGITNQRETTVLWDRESGRPIHNAIVWQCRRTADICRVLKEKGVEDDVQRRTGLVLDPYFSGTKLKWILDEVPEARKRAEAGRLLFGTIDTFLVWRLTGGAAHVTDVSNASRTLLFNIEDLAWDPWLLELLDIPSKVLPEVRSNSEVYGCTKGLGFLPDGIPIAGMAGDQQAALFGQACFGKGQAKCTYGTGAFLMLNVGSSPVHSSGGLLATVGWKLGNQVTYALEGSVFIAGAAVQWLRDGLKIIESAPEIEALARSVPDSGGVVFVPALAGLGAPHWKADARGAITGLTRGTQRAHLARATLEGIALSVHDVLSLMEREAKTKLSGLRVDGGAAANNFLVQLQADLLGSTIVRPTVLETTALGAAMLAGLAVGVWSGLEDVQQRWREERSFEPDLPADQVQSLLDRWSAAIERL
ncbi:MAG: glycerol kinase GlpK [Deltaproteobacteria bacterium]|nr:glycerol kinase GlpK [Deltaproteobacteria bacterium]